MPPFVSSLVVLADYPFVVHCTLTDACNWKRPWTSDHWRHWHLSSPGQRAQIAIFGGQHCSVNCWECTRSSDIGAGHFSSQIAPFLSTTRCVHWNALLAFLDSAHISAVYLLTGALASSAAQWTAVAIQMAVIAVTASFCLYLKAIYPLIFMPLTIFTKDGSLFVS